MSSAGHHHFRDVDNEAQRFTVCAGSNVVLHHELTVPVGRLHHSGKLKVHVPVRKIVHCRTHDLQQSLMCKLGRATQNFQATEGALLVRNVREESPFEVVSSITTLIYAELSSVHRLLV